MAAITCTNKIQEGNSSDLDTYITTATLTGSANKLYLALVVHTAANADLTTGGTPALTGGGLTWVLVAETIVANGQRAHLFRAMSATPGAAATLSAAFTATATHQTSCSFIVDEFDNVDTSGTNGSGAIVQAVAANGSAATTASATLAAFADAVNNATYFGGGIDGSAAITAEAGLTKSGETSAASGPARRRVSEFRTAADTTPSFTWTGNQAWCGIGVELKAVSAAAAKKRRMLTGVGR